MTQIKTIDDFLLEAIKYVDISVSYDPLIQILKDHHDYRWRKVNEEFPHYDVQVMAKGKSGYYYVGYFKHEDVAFNEDPTTGARIFFPTPFYDHGKKYLNLEVTHWRYIYDPE